jgi:2-dehydropantoate 2-reductase
LRINPEIVSIDGLRAAVTVLDTFDESTQYDLIIVTVLAHQVEALIPALAASCAKNILFMFNTFEKTEKWRDRLGADRLSHGFPNIQAFFEEGKLRSVVSGPGIVTTLSSPKWADLIRQAGMATEVELDMDSYRRTHVAFVVPLMLAGQWTWQRESNLSWNEASSLTLALLEALALVRSLGHTIKPALVARLAKLPFPLLTSAVWLFSRTAGVKDLGAFGPGEVRALIDSMAAVGSGKIPKLLSVRP